MHKKIILAIAAVLNLVSAAVLLYPRRQKPGTLRYLGKFGIMYASFHASGVFLFPFQMRKECKPCCPSRRNTLRPAQIRAR